MSLPKEKYQGKQIWLSSRKARSTLRSYFVYRGSHKIRFLFTEGNKESVDKAMQRVKEFIDKNRATL